MTVDPASDFGSLRTSHLQEVLGNDRFTEAREPEGRTMFGVERLQEVVAGFSPKLSLHACAERAKKAIDQFTRTKELQDDLTLLLVRRKK